MKIDHKTVAFIGIDYYAMSRDVVYTLEGSGHTVKAVRVADGLLEYNTETKGISFFPSSRLPVFPSSRVRTDARYIPTMDTFTLSWGTHAK